MRPDDAEVLGAGEIRCERPRQKQGSRVTAGCSFLPSAYSSGTGAADKDTGGCSYSHAAFVAKVSHDVRTVPGNDRKQRGSNGNGEGCETPLVPEF